MNIAIIGAGVTGSLILKYLIENKSLFADLNIYIYEKRDHIAKGSPYEKDTPIKMLNVGTDYMSADRDNLDDLNEWLEANVEDPFNFEGLLSRELYGEYLASYFKTYYDNSLVQVIHKEVTDMEVIEGDLPTYRLKTSEWEDVIFDTVFFAFGNPHYKDFYDLQGKDGYIHDPYKMSEKLAKLDPNSKIGILGAGASSVDVFRYLSLKVKPKDGFDFFVRSSITKFPGLPLDGISCQQTITHEWIESQLKEHDGLIPLDSIIQVVVDDLKTSGIDVKSAYEKYKDMDNFDNYQKILDENPEDLRILQFYFGETSTYHARLFGYLSEFDKKRYMKDFHPIREIFYTLVPDTTTQWIIDSIKEGYVRFRKGLEEVEYKDGKFIVHGHESYEVDHLINTTGFDLNLFNNAEHNPFIKNLLDKKIIGPITDTDGINVNWPSCTILSTRYGQLPNLISIGLFHTGLHYKPNGVTTLKETVHFAMQEYLDGLK